MDAATKRERVARVPYWFHSIDLGDGVVTPGQLSHEYLARVWATARPPELRGKTVLDVGAWDGYFSFEAERCGAARVVALDHWVWSIDRPGLSGHKARRRELGLPPPRPERTPFWHPDSLPGKRGFDTAQEMLGSMVETVVADYGSVDVVALGSFDVTLFLGVLYHLRDPLGALERLALLTRETAIIETQAVYLGDGERRALFEFYEQDELAGDATNWWAPNLQGLQKACRAAGFRSVDVVSPYPPTCFWPEEHKGYRLTVHARR